MCSALVLIRQFDCTESHWFVTLTAMSSWASCWARSCRARSLSNWSWPLRTWLRDTSEEVWIGRPSIFREMPLNVLLTAVRLLLEGFLFCHLRNTGLFNCRDAVIVPSLRILDFIDIFLNSNCRTLPLFRYCRWCTFLFFACCEDIILPLPIALTSCFLLTFLFIINRWRSFDSPWRWDHLRCVSVGAFGGVSPDIGRLTLINCHVFCDTISDQLLMVLVIDHCGEGAIC